MSWGHVIRVYPKGVGHKQISKRANGMALKVYLLGLSYGAVGIVLSSLGMGIGKASVYRAVQEVARQVPGIKRKSRLDGCQTKAVAQKTNPALRKMYLRYSKARKPGKGKKA